MVVTSTICISIIVVEGIFKNRMYQSSNSHVIQKKHCWLFFVHWSTGDSRHLICSWMSALEAKCANKPHNLTFLLYFRSKNGFVSINLQIQENLVTHLISIWLLIGVQNISFMRFNSFFHFHLLINWQQAQTLGSGEWGMLKIIK